MIFGIQATAFSGPQEKLSDEDVAAIREVFDKLSKAVVAEDIDATLAFYTDQTIEVYPNGIANVGKANMTQRWKGFMPNYDYKEASHKDLQIVGLGDTAICCTLFKRTYHYRDAEEPTTREGRQFFIFKKIDGSWKIAVAHWIID